MQVEPMKPVLKAPGTMLLKLIYDEPLSNFAFNFNLRRYAKATDFGCSKLRRALPAVMSVDRVTVNWSAPEVLRGASDYTAGPHIAHAMRFSFQLNIKQYPKYVSS